ncbi:MAG: fibronectin type III domain-containing protein, partial [Candidatus Zixiibacteriota bacterium]
MDPRRFFSDRLHCPVLLTVIIATIGFVLGGPSAVVGQDATEPGDSIPASSQVDSVLVERTPQSATNLRASDTPDDAGGSISLRWDLSVDDYGGGRVTGYRILRAELVGDTPGEFVEVGDVTSGASEYVDGNTSDDFDYIYMIAAVNSGVDEDGVSWEVVAESEATSPVQSSAQWFNWQRVNAFVGVVLLCAFILYFISQAKAGKELFIRKIAGLEAVDEAIGRATEMGKKIFYVPGGQDMDNVQTIAGVTILGRVAELAARYETYLEVPVARSLVMVTAKDVVKEAYTRAGRPDAFQEDQVHYLTDDQFGYAAAIDGMVVREKPATIFYMGAFYAESLILAETGNSVGAIQIAGTGMPAQLPFFVAACDYTLIGEELFAASAYLSREPRQLGSLKGQDIGKGIILVALVVGILLETF